ncbi:MAG: hypothetical protein CME64_02480 [Halobacteriovoraceae bacterium]|nr:hypothetical protein [Halobacteriovoraceae bacterium]|tara:strand:- start:26680 stop:27423 length:744 start_codon:yes stop_codon:yes gene_type:complete
MKFLSLIIVALMMACSTEKPKGKTEAEVLYKEAKSMMEDGRYLLATEKLNQLKNQYPYSFYATPSELMLADILYKQENYVEAAASYLLFREFHPKHERISYVIYKIAESYYQQIPDTYDRDLQPAFEAIKYYKDLLLRFPSSSYAKQAKSKIKEAQEMIRLKEKYIADFYYKTEVYDAARWRYLHILENFQDKDLVNHAMKRVILSSYNLKEYDKCGLYGKRFEEIVSKKDSEIASVIKTCIKKLNN